MPALLNRLQTYGRLIKFSHTIFALPFALAAVLLAHRQQPVSLSTLGWIVLALAAARSAAMGFNRYVDYEFDRRNPRTATRPLVVGDIDHSSVLLLIFASSLLFLLSAGMLGHLCLALAPLPSWFFSAILTPSVSLPFPTWCSGLPSVSPRSAPGWPVPGPSTCASCHWPWLS